MGGTARLMPVRIAIYDMDKTITRAATWTPFLRHAARGWRRAMWPAAGLLTIGYLAKIIDRARLKELTHRVLIGGRLTASRADTLARGFADRVELLDGARARIAADRAAGYRVVLATASYAFYVRAIAARLGVDDVIATGSAQVADGIIEPRIAGENCYGPAKLRMIEGWMADERIARADAHVRFYSDHVSDAPALEWADEAYAVNAHAPLQALARVRGWTVLDWR